MGEHQRSAVRTGVIGQPPSSALAIEDLYVVPHNLTSYFPEDKDLFVEAAPACWLCYRLNNQMQAEAKRLLAKFGYEATNKRAANRGARWSLHWLGHAAEYINEPSTNRRVNRI